MSFLAALVLIVVQIPLAGSNTERDMDEIREIVDSVKKYIRIEYEELLESSPGVGGVLSVSFAITPEGAVNGISVDVSGDLESLVPGLIEMIGDLDFGVSEEQIDDLDVTIPFSLFPPESTLSQGN